MKILVKKKKKKLDKKNLPGLGDSLRLNRVEEVTENEWFCAFRMIVTLKLNLVCGRCFTVLKSQFKLMNFVQERVVALRSSLKQQLIVSLVLEYWKKLYAKED